MRHEMAMTKNVRRAMSAVRALAERGPGTEGMALLGGEPGEGKTTTLAWCCNQTGGVYVRANACWSVTSMLAALCHELGLPQGRLKGPMLAGIIAAMAENPRPIFVDEADYMLRGFDMLDTLRDIYDMVPGSCVVLVGMEELAMKLRAHGRFARRITQWIEFKGLDAADARVVADAICEVPVADDLVAHLHRAARGNVGRMVVGLDKIEAMGKASGQVVDMAAWGGRELFYDQALREKTAGRKS